MHLQQVRFDKRYSSHSKEFIAVSQKAMPRNDLLLAEVSIHHNDPYVEHADIARFKQCSSPLSLLLNHYILLLISCYLRRESLTLAGELGVSVESLPSYVLFVRGNVSVTNGILCDNSTSLTHCLERQDIFL